MTVSTQILFFHGGKNILDMQALRKYHMHISFLKKGDTHKSTLAKRKLH